MKKRICIIADSVDVDYGGISVYSKELINNLVQIDKQNEYTFIHLYENVFFQNKNHKIIPKSKIIFADFKRKFIDIPKYVNSEKFDILHDLYHITPFALSKVGAKKVVTIHDITPLLFPEWHTFSRVRKHRLLLKRSLDHADTIISDSENTKKDIIKRFKNNYKIEVVHLGSPKIKNIFNTNSSDRFILFVGSLEPRKNIDNLIKAFEIVRKKLDSIKLIIIGKQGWKYNKILKNIYNSEYRSDIIYKGYLSKEEMEYHYGNCSVFVYPSLYEGFGLPILEAMSFGAPVIASNNSSIPEITGDAPILIDPNSYSEIAEKIIYVLENDVERMKMKEKSFLNAKKYSWEQTAQQTIDVYEKLFQN